MITTSAVVLVTTQVYAGGSTELPKLSDAIVSCQGEGGEIIFNVFKKDFKGDLLDLRENPASFIKITDPKIIDLAKKSGIVREYAWDKTNFFKSLGINPLSIKDHLALRIEAGAGNEIIPVVNLQGGPLKTEYTTNHLMIKSSRS